MKMVDGKLEFHKDRNIEVLSKLEDYAFELTTFVWKAKANNYTKKEIEEKFNAITNKYKEFIKEI